jgi:hypothetical protein
MCPVHIRLRNQSFQLVERCRAVTTISPSQIMIGIELCRTNGKLSESSLHHLATLTRNGARPSARERTDCHGLQLAAHSLQGDRRTGAAPRGRRVSRLRHVRRASSTWATPSAIRRESSAESGVPPATRRLTSLTRNARWRSLYVAWAFSGAAPVSCPTCNDKYRPPFPNEELGAAVVEP